MLLYFGLHNFHTHFSPIQKGIHYNFLPRFPPFLQKHLYLPFKSKNHVFIISSWQCHESQLSKARLSRSCIFIFPSCSQDIVAIFASRTLLLLQFGVVTQLEGGIVSKEYKTKYILPCISLFFLLLSNLAFFRCAFPKGCKKFPLCIYMQYNLLTMRCMSSIDFRYFQNIASIFWIL